MSDLFHLSAPWWHFPLRALAIYLMVMVMMRISGKRAVGQFTPFDLVLLILIGNAVQNGLNGGDNSITGAFLLAGCLIVLNYAVAWITARSRRAEELIEGVPKVLMRDGHIYDQVLREELVSRDDLMKALRLNNIGRLEDVALALLETNGSISAVSRQSGGDERAAVYVSRLPERSLHPRHPHRRPRTPGHPDGN